MRYYCRVELREGLVGPLGPLSRLRNLPGKLPAKSPGSLSGQAIRDSGPRDSSQGSLVVGQGPRGGSGGIGGCDGVRELQGPGLEALSFDLLEV